MSVSAEDFLNAESFLDDAQPSGAAASPQSAEGFLDAESFLGEPAAPAQGRISSAVSSFARGVGQVPAGLSKSIAFIGAPDSDVFKSLDAIDNGEKPSPKSASDVAYYLNYQEAAPEERARMRQELTDSANSAMQSPFYKAGQGIDKWFTETFPTNPEYQQEFWASKVPQALGSAGGFVAAGLTTRGALKPFGPAISGISTYGTPAALGAGTNSVDQFEQALAKGADIQTALEASELGAKIGLTEGVPIGNLLNRLDKGSGGRVKQYLVNAVKQGTEEAVQEAFSGIMNAAVAQKLYDPKQGIWTMERGEEAAVGFTTGAVLETLMSIALPGRQRIETEIAQEKPDQHTAEEVTNYASSRVKELGQKPNLTPAEQQEHDFLKQNIGNPAAIAQAQGVELTPVGLQEQAKSSAPPPPTPGDIASPIPTDLIQQGKAIIQGSLGGQSADKLLQDAGFPAINSQITLKTRNGGTITATIVDAFDEGGRRGAKLKFGNGRIVAETFDELQGRISPAAQQEVGDAAGSVRNGFPGGGEVAAQTGPTVEAGGESTAVSGVVGQGPGTGAVQQPGAGVPGASPVPVDDGALTPLPEGWSESAVGGMATNKDPETGGIVDKQIASGKWFAIPNRDGSEPLEGFDTREQALAALQSLPEPELVDEDDPSARIRADIAGETPERASLIVLRQVLEDGSDVMNDGQFPPEINDQALYLSDRIQDALDSGEDIAEVQQEALASIKEWLKQPGLQKPEFDALQSIERRIESQLALPPGEAAAGQMQTSAEAFLDAPAAPELESPQSSEPSVNSDLKPSTRLPGVEGLVQREGNAHQRFVNAVKEQFGLTGEQAGRAYERLAKEKLIKLDPVTGQFKLKDGRAWDREVMLRAAEETQAPQQPAKTSEPVLRIDDYTDKSIIIRGKTKENMERIKDAGKKIGIRALWNKKANGWVFPKSRATEVRDALADLVDSNDKFAKAVRDGQEMAQGRLPIEDDRNRQRLENIRKLAEAEKAPAVSRPGEQFESYLDWIQEQSPEKLRNSGGTLREIEMDERLSEPETAALVRVFKQKAGTLSGRRDTSRDESRREDRRQTADEERESLSPEEIQELRAENARLKQKVDTDAMTGVKSQAAYLRDAPNAKGAVQMDLSLFKGYNTLLTEDGGDLVLKVFGQVMQEVAPGKAYRKGGDEFAFLTDSTEDAQDILNRMQEAAASIQFSMLDKDGNPVTVEGIPFTGGVGPNADAALKARDAAKGDYDRNALPPNVRRVEQAGPEEGAVQDSGSDTEREGTGRDAATETETGSTGGDQGVDAQTESQRIAAFFALQFASGNGFPSITNARKAAEGLLGRKIYTGTIDAKILEEGIELGAVVRARQIVEKGGTPQEIYQQLVDLYGMMPSLSVRTSTSIEQQAYSTPLPLSYLASRLAGITKKTTVLEPTAGNGALLIEASPKLSLVNELNPDRAEALRSQGFRVTEEDATTLDDMRGVDVVIANPPFGTVKGDNGQNKRFQVNEQYSTGEIDHAIALKSLESMKDEGSAVLLVGSVGHQAKTEDARSDAYNGKAKREFYLTLYRDYNVVDHFTVAGNLWEKQGAGYPVDVIVIRGHGKSALPLPAVKPPKIYNAWGDLSEVLNARYQDAPRTAGSENRSSDRSAAGKRSAPSDGGDRDRSGGSRPDRDGGLAVREPTGVRKRPVAPESNDTGSVESESRDVAESVVGEQPARRARPAPVAGENLRQVGYQPASQSESMGTLVPVNMQTAVQAALDKLSARVGDIDTFVAKKLGYKVKELSKYFGAEQVDAIALAIDNMEREAGFIIGDQTGIGKGRVVAAIIRYALKSKRTPIFVTEKPNLYGDMYRDLTDIGVPEMLGRKPKILMTNAAQTVPLDEEGTVLKTGAAGTHNELLRQITAEGLGDAYDMVFSTYSQMQTLKGETTPRMKFLEALTKGGILIFDESHNAGGNLQKGEGEQKKQEMNRASFARELGRAAHGVFYSSATYAKRPEVMDLYATTDMRLAVSDISNLAAAIQKGGVPMQQVVASMLSGAGQYIRRERSFDGITYNAPVVSVPRETYSGYSRALDAIQKFSEGFIKRAVKRMDKELKAEGKSMSADGATGGAGAASTNFTSIMHNLIDQMLLSIKADVAAERAIEAIKNGEKPVITVANTMGSFIQDYVDDLGINPGDKVNLSFNALLDRYLERTRWLSVRKPFMKAGDKAEKKYLTDEELGASGVAAFDSARELIRNLDLSAMPVSPIDHIRARIQKAGYKVGEITGRGVTLDYRPNGTYYKVRPGKEVSIAGRRKSIADFNNGAVDAMIINQAGSTGLSLHASKTFKDQKKRRMIIAQAEKNIDTHMQMLGRVNRTGQVVVPEYDQLVADVPAEKRPAAVLAKKMASLNANTTASRGGALMAEDVPDFMNQYGDEVAARVMADMPEIHDALGAPLSDDEAGYAVPDAMRKVTGRIPLLPIDQQEMVYEILEGEYRALVEQKEAAGESVLEAKTLDLDAKTEERRQVVAPTGGDSPFADGVYIETVDVKRLGRPHPSAKVIEMVSESAGFKGQATVENMGPLQEAGRAATAEIYRNAGRELDAYRVEALDSIESPEARKAASAKLDGIQSRFKSLLSVGLIGSQIKLMTEAGNLYGVVTKIQRTGKAKNPIALGAWKMTVALADATRQITLPMSQLYTKDTQPNNPAQSDIIIDRANKITADMTVMEAFDRMQSKARETRTIITGNILAGFDHVKGRGAIINFTDNQGNVRQGILMSRDFDYDEQQAELPVDFRTAEQVIAFTDRGHAVHSSDDALVVTKIGDRIRFEVAASKARGGRYYLDKGILAAVGSDFVKAADKMRADVTRDRAADVLEEMKRAGAGFRAINNLPVAREIAGSVGSREQSEDGDAPEPKQAKYSLRQTKTQEFKRWFGDSKVVDENGEPLAVYHGTARNVSEFRGGSNYFTADREYANFYASKEGGNVMPVYLRVENPKELTSGQWWDAINNDTEMDLVDQAELEGHDGIVVRDFMDNLGPSDMWVAFAPEQIKSATGNRGTFDPNDVRINYRLRDEFGKDAGRITSSLAVRLQKIGIDDKVALALRDRIQAVVDGKASEADGRYLRGVIEIAVNAADTVKTLNHEAIHALRDLGLLRDAEWRSLEKAAKADKDRMKELRARYKKIGQESEEVILEEAIAEMYADWAAERVEPIGFVKRAFERIRDFLQALARALSGRGYNSVDLVFKAIERGDVGSRQPRDNLGQFTGAKYGGVAKPQTETKAFMDWFGDSKVVDENGKPLVVYHGTNKSFDKFDPETRGSINEADSDSRMGFFFSDDAEVASSYSTRAVYELGEDTAGANVMPVYLMMKNPMIVNWDGFDYDSEYAADKILEAQNKGNDGVIFRNIVDGTAGNVMEESTTYAVFDPSQIKSAIGNRGTFDPENPDIRYALRPGDFKAPAAPQQPKKPIKRGPVPTFDSKESEARWQDARQGVSGSDGLLEGMKTRLSRIADGFSRHFVHLPNTAKFSEAREQLRKLEAAPQAAKEDAVRKLRSVVEGMTREDLDLFTRKVVLDDLSHEADIEHDLPFGLTPASVKSELDKIDAALAEREDLREKVKVRSKLVKQLADEMVDAGVLDRERLKNPAYYRHQVLEYARAQVAYAKGAGKKLKTPKWARRMGSSLDINANLLEAEFEWMQKALMDISTARTIDWFRKSQYNVRDDVIAAGREHNKKQIDRILAKDMLDNGYVKSSGRETSPLNEEWMGFKQRIAMGLEKVREVIEGGTLANIPREFRRVADSIVEQEQSEMSIFPFLTWILDNDMPGAMGAAQAFKALNQRKVWMQSILGDQYADPTNIEDLTKRFAPKGYTTWQPDEGKLLFTAKTIPEHVIDRMLVKIAAEGAGQVSAEELQAALSSVRSLLAVGGPKYQMVLPEELAASLNSLRDEEGDGLFDALVAVPLSWWKRWVLINPRRVLKYNLNNLSGDLDAIIAGNPRVVKKLPQSIRELWQVMIKGETPSDRYREAVERGVFDSGLSVQEIPDINYLNEFEGLINPPKLTQEPVRFVLSPLVKVWRTLSKYTQFRENWMRYAAYLDFIERLEAGENMQSIGYGASSREMVDSIKDKKDKAALLARDLVGDYGAISHYGKGIRRKVIPFWSWMEINTKRYWRLGINAWDQGIGQGFRTTGIIGATIGARTSAYLVLRAAAMYAMVQLWNNLFFGDEEDELSAEDRARVHIILGKDDSGQIRMLRFQGALSDYLGWVGFPDAVGVISDIEKGRAEFSELVTTILKAPVNKLMTSITPVISLPVEILSGKTYWPDVFNPRAIQDKWRHVAKLFSVENEYDAIFDRPSRGYGRSITEAVIYSRDVGENAYNQIKGLAYDWERRETGQTGSGTYQTPRSKALHDWRLAQKYGDREAEHKAYLRMEELGVNHESLQSSIRNAHPLGSIPVKSRGAFLQTLTAKERQAVDLAIDWYEATYLD